MKEFMRKFDKFFAIQASGSSIKTEFIAGVTTFFAMCYIISVNPSMMTNNFTPGTPLWNTVFIATALSAVIGTLLMGLWAKLPFAQAPGMGLNSFFAVSFMGCVFAGASVAEQGAAMGKGLAVIFMSGIIFLILSVTGARKAIAKSLPSCLKKSIPAGIGLFIAFIGLKNSGLVVADRWTFVTMADLTVWANASVVIVSMAGFLLIGILSKLKVKGAVIIGILFSTVLYYLFAWQWPNFSTIVGVGAFEDFAEYGLFNLNFKGLFSGQSFAGVMNILMLVVTFCLVDLFDTLGTLVGTASEANMLDANGDPKRLSQALMCDSIATVTGSLLGTSTVTTYVESASGVSAGGRTGLTAVVVALLFFVSMFFSPLAAIVPVAATAPALIFVGVLMLKNFKDVDMNDMTHAIPAFLTLVIMPLTYSIANGIAVGMISYCILKLCTGKIKEIHPVLAVLAILFLARFALVFMGTIPTYAF